MEVEAETEVKEPPEGKLWVNSSKQKQARSSMCLHVEEEKEKNGIKRKEEEKKEIMRKEEKKELAVT